MVKARTKKQSRSITDETRKSVPESTRRILQAFAKAHSEYLDAISSSYREFEETAQAVYQRYVDELYDAWQASDPQRKSIEAHQRYVSALADGWEKSRVQPRLAAAYRQYLAQIQAAIGDIDVNRFDPQNLVSVGRSILSAMWYGHATFPDPMATRQRQAVKRGRR